MENEEKRAVTIAEAADVKYLSPDDAAFAKNGDFVSAEISGEKYQRVYLHRSFPFDAPSAFISVQNADNEEIGLIRDLSEFDSATVEILDAELLRKYYMPKITKIVSLKETRGYSYWKVESDSGVISFTVQDTQRSISRYKEDKALISDICGNRYEIDSISALDKKSRKKLEIYL